MSASTPSTNSVLLKVLNENGTTYHSGRGRWHLPKNGKPGRWMPVIKGDLEPCVNGYHLCRPADLIHWIGPAVFEAEYDGKRVDVDDQAETKVVVRRARLIRRLNGWNERTLRLFAVECAERVLPIFERERPSDDRPRRALEVARRYANGEATEEELAAAWNAVWDAAWDAAGAAARDAVRDAVRDAARAAAWNAAGAAAGDAARAAAWNAVRDAARDAARAAAWNAAWDAAWNAAWDAERTWQSQRLIELLGIGGEVQP
jgi:hypothetical protein